MQAVHVADWHLGFADLFHMGSPCFRQTLERVKSIDRRRFLFTEILPVVRCSVDCSSLKHTKLHPCTCKNAASATCNIHPVSIGKQAKPLQNGKPANKAVSLAGAQSVPPQFGCGFVRSCSGWNIHSKARLGSCCTSRTGFNSVMNSCKVVALTGRTAGSPGTAGKYGLK